MALFTLPDYTGQKSVQDQVSLEGKGVRERLLQDRG